MAVLGSHLEHCLAVSRVSGTELFRDRRGVSLRRGRVGHKHSSWTAGRLPISAERSPGQGPQAAQRAAKPTLDAGEQRGGMREIRRQTARKRNGMARDSTPGGHSPNDDKGNLFFGFRAGGVALALGVSRDACDKPDRFSGIG